MAKGYVVEVLKGRKGDKGDPSVSVGDVALGAGQYPKGDGTNVVAGDFAADVAATAAVQRVDPKVSGQPRQELRITPNGDPYWVPSGFFDAADYGVIPDGVTDNATAFANLCAAVNAVANTDGRPVAVRFNGNADGKAYVYSDGLAFTRPVLLYGTGVLSYSGTGYAVKLGPDNLDDTNYQTHRRYIVSDLTFTDGANYTHGLFFNDHVVEPRVCGVHFLGFGNATGFGIYGQADNWDTLVQDCDWFAGPQHPSRRRNWIRLRGYHATSTGHASRVAGDPDYGNSLLRVIDCHATNLNAGGIGIWTNGSNGTVTGCKIEAFDPNLRFGAWAVGFRVTDNYFETTRITGGDSCIQYGDDAGDELPATFLDSLIITDNYVNLHNSDIGIVASFIGPTTGSTGLKNTQVSRNWARGLASTRELVKQNNVSGQTGNMASDNLGITVLHTAGGNISNWAGNQGERPKFRSNVDTSMYLQLQPGATADQIAGLEFLGWNGSSKAQLFYSPAGNRFYFKHISTNKDMNFDTSGNLQVAGALGVNGATPSRPTVTGSRGGNAALASLLTALANMGLITDSTTA